MDEKIEKDTTVAVTGGTSDVGLATARALGRRGVRLALLARRENLLEDVSAKLRRIGAEVLAVRGDVGVPADLVRFASETARRFGRIGGLFLNAGTAPFAPLAAVTPEGIEALEEGLARDGAVGPYDGPDAELLAEEVQLSCTTALLVCLSRPLRMAYILGDILGMAGPDAAEVLEVTPAAFRKRLSLARREVRRFLAPRCGLVAAENTCACSRQVRHDIEVGWIDPRELRFAGKGVRRRLTAGLDAVFDATEVFLAHPDYDPPVGVLAVRTLLARVEQHAATASTGSSDRQPVTPPGLRCTSTEDVGLNDGAIS